MRHEVHQEGRDGLSHSQQVLDQEAHDSVQAHDLVDDQAGIQAVQVAADLEVALHEVAIAEVDALAIKCRALSILTLQNLLIK